MERRPLFVGIDLGTTNSATAVFDGDEVVVVRNSQGAGLTPSVVRIDAKGRVTVGRRAQRMRDRDPDNTTSEFKRLMGTAHRIEFPASTQARRPEELAAEVLKALRADIEAQLGIAVERAVLSVPALFELPQASATTKAARLAGFEEVQLIQEPVASALAAGWTDACEGYWLVYDLGGGTFDASILEAEDGFLRVVGHDGDNFLGGRDMDSAIVKWALGELRDGEAVDVDPSDPINKAGIRSLRVAAEEAKIDLSRASEADVAIRCGFGDGDVDVDLVLDRQTLEGLVDPLIDRTLEVCRRLMAAHGVERLERVVLVGGPTAMPRVRARVGAALDAQVGEGLDPMYLVARGASLYAASLGLDGRPAVVEDRSEDAVPVWLQFPAMSSDRRPQVVGRFTGADGDGVARVRLVRTVPSPWAGEWSEVGEEQAFVAQVELESRARCRFVIEAEDSSGTAVRVVPPDLHIVHGLTLGDPPLSRSIGVALANDTVRVYFERGAPLPARRTVALHTVQAVPAGEDACILRIPVVQGEFESAHLCRLVGALEIRGEALDVTLPTNSLIEVTLEVDRGGQLAARAHVPALGRVFSEVAHLVVPEASVDALAAGLQDATARLATFQADAFRQGSAGQLAELTSLNDALAELGDGVELARGGDADAAQQARRALIDIDARLEALELARSWPEVEQDARETLAWALQWTMSYGSKAEAELLDVASDAIRKALAERDAAEVQRQLRLVRNVGSSAFARHPQAWRFRFEHAASHAAQCTDLAAADQLVRDGRAAVERGDDETLKVVVNKLWRLMPPDARERQQSHLSGVR